jgi:hypothetical protein
MISIPCNDVETNKLVASLSAVSSGGKIRQDSDISTISQQTNSKNLSLSSVVSDDDDIVDDDCAIKIETKKIKKNKNKKVSFSIIEFREYPMIPGDNPATLCGVPITIDWIPIDDIIECTVDEYETDRRPRKTVELRMPSWYRTDVLRSLGFSTKEIQAAIKEANIIRHKRVRTLETMQLAPAQAAFERMKRATLNATIRRGQKAKERKLLQEYSIKTTKEYHRISGSTDSCNSETLHSIDMDTVDTCASSILTAH